MQADIAPLFDYLRQERRKAHQAIVRQLRSKRYATMMSRWEAFVATPLAAPSTAPAAALPIRQVAGKRIRKKSRAVMRLGRQLLHSTDDVRLHAFRIECKKLRYLMEFFAPLFPQDSLVRSIKHIKVLQDTLGDYNDLRVQQEALQTWVELMSRQPGAHGTIIAMGHMVSQLESDKQRLRQTLPKTFETFMSTFSPPEA
jgi:CHAD domain-containing protein